MQNEFPQTSLNAYTDEYSALQHILNSYAYNYIHTMIPVVITEINEGLVNVKPLIKVRNIVGETIDDNVTIYNIPVMQMTGSKFNITIEPSVGDKGLLIACEMDITNYKDTHEEAVVSNNRHYNYSDGFYLPLDFSGEKTGIEISAGTANLKIEENNITINCSNATVNADNINLGGSGGKGVARIGDSVDLETGLITGGSSTVKAV